MFANFDPGVIAYPYLDNNRHLPAAVCGSPYRDKTEQVTYPHMTQIMARSSVSPRM